MLIDMYESVWTTLYDETAEQLTGMSATEFARLNEEGLQDLLRKVRYKEIKLKMLTKNEEFNKHPPFEQLSQRTFQTLSILFRQKTTNTL